MKEIFNEELEERLNKIEYRLDQVEDDIGDIFINKNMDYNDNIHNMCKDLIDQRTILKIISIISIINFIVNMIMYIRRKKWYDENDTRKRYWYKI